MGVLLLLLLLLLLRLKLLVVSLELQRSAWLSRGWCVNHMVLWWRTDGTVSGGSWCGPLPLLLLGHLTSPHGALLIDGNASRVIAGQV
jgi:hypothetical protein